MERTIVIRTKRTKSGWEEIPGHCCRTQEDFDEYVSLSPDNLRVVPTPFDNGGYVKEDEV